MGPAVIPIIIGVGTVLQFAGQMQQAKAVKQDGLNTVAMMNYKAAQQEQAAGQEIAAAQRAKNDELRRATLLASRGLAVAGASGGGASDPTVQGLIADIEGEGAYRGALDIYQGAERGRQLKQGALTSELEGQAANASARSKSKALTTSAWGSLAMSAGGMYSKYGGGGMKAEQIGAPVVDATPSYDTNWPTDRFR